MPRRLQRHLPRNSYGKFALVAFGKGRIDSPLELGMDMHVLGVGDINVGQRVVMNEFSRMGGDGYGLDG